MKKSTLLHLRIPFSFFLLPVFLFAAAIADVFDWEDFWLLFFILHFLVYPASNGYNSYFDKDEESIGGLKNPPKVSRELYWVALIMDLVALVLAAFISLELIVLLVVYGGVSKAYSHPSIRLKKYPFIGWLAAGIFQGLFTFLLVYHGLTGVSVLDIDAGYVWWPAVLSTALLMGSYPMTQVYQHGEDSRRGDRTISLMLGVLGTFHFTGLFFTLSVAGFMAYFLAYFMWIDALVFMLVLLPVLGHFSWWYWQVRKNPIEADFERTMQLNFLSAICLNTFFIWLMF